MRRSSAPTDNGDGTVSVVATNSGLSPAFKLPNGPPIVLDVGLVEFVLTLDATTGDFISFELLRDRGQHPPGCAAIVAALTQAPETASRTADRGGGGALGPLPPELFEVSDVCEIPDERLHQR
ncbi:MAG TPA: hypothetical protein VIL92_08730 [Gaiellaceae bacterium]